MDKYHGTLNISQIARSTHGESTSAWLQENCVAATPAGWAACLDQRQARDASQLSSAVRLVTKHVQRQLEKGGSRSGSIHYFIELLRVEKGKLYSTNFIFILNCLVHPAKRMWQSIRSEHRKTTSLNNFGSWIKGLYDTSFLGMFMWVIVVQTHGELILPRGCLTTSDGTSHISAMAFQVTKYGTKGGKHGRLALGLIGCNNQGFP